MQTIPKTERVSILLYAERQMPFNPNAKPMDIEWKLRYLNLGRDPVPDTTWSPQKRKCFYASKLAFILLFFKACSSVTATTASVPRYSTLVQLVHYTLKVLARILAIWHSASMIGCRCSSSSSHIPLFCSRKHAALGLNGNPSDLPTSQPSIIQS